MLPFDVGRCTGLFGNSSGGVCSERETCARHLAYSEWDKKSISASYRNSIWISVSPAVDPCDHKIEVEYRAYNHKIEVENDK